MNAARFLYSSSYSRPFVGISIAQATKAYVQALSANAVRKKEGHDLWTFNEF
jgi:hypothetical protein